jgi:hypothetical protein
MGVHEPRKVLTGALPTLRLGEQVFILAYKHPAKLGGAIEQVRVGKSRSRVPER